MFPFVKLLLAALIISSVFLQITHAFCIHNKLSHNVASIDIYNPVGDDKTSFKKVIYRGRSECCHYSNKDCNPTGDPNFIRHFRGWINYNGFYREGNEKMFRCEAGGGLNFFGTSPEDTRVVCVSPNGTINEDAFLYNIY